MASFSCLATDTRPANAARAAADQPATTAKPVPWIEVRPRNPGSVEGAIEGLRNWQRVTDTAIVGVGPFQLQVLLEFRRLFPDMKIIPGITTSEILTPAGFDSINGWARVARAVNEACRITASRVYVLENEGALAKYVAGEYAMHWERLAEGLRQLPAGKELWCYPSIAGQDEVLARYVRLCQAVQEVCEVRFIDHSSIAEPQYVGKPATLRQMQSLDGVAREPLIPLVYLMRDRDRWWPLERMAEAVRLAKTDVVILYPGAKAWVAASQAAAADPFLVRAAASQPAAP